VVALEHSNPSRQEITLLLQAWSHGEDAALAELMPQVYGRLRRIAAGYLRREGQNHPWQAADLVHEAYLRLLRQRQVCWNDRSHFFSIVARTMRRILVDHARGAKYEKRGGRALLLPLAEADGRVAEADGHVAEATLDLSGLREALAELAVRSAEQARIVDLRFFGGLTKVEIARAMGISESTVARRWRLARAWLHRFLSRRE
jgi:RNA polymerase sigma factor (TIGR02999 family)